MKKLRILSIVLLSSLLLAACGSAITPVPAPANYEPFVFSGDSYPLVPGNTITASGQGPAASEPIVFGQDAVILFKWTQSSRETFVLYLKNNDLGKANTPYSQLNLDSVTGPSEHELATSLPAGEYTLIIERADGPWDFTITMTDETPMIFDITLPAPAP